MPSIIGSGLDIPGLVSKLVSAARTPGANRITAAGNASNAKLSAIGKIKNAMTDVQNALKAINKQVGGPSWSVRLPEHAAITASAAPNAVAGRYQVEVVQLAQAHKLVGNHGYDAQHSFAAGSVTLSVGHGASETTKTIAVNANASLADIASAVNDAFAGKGITASVVDADDGQHLTLTATESGKENEISFSATGTADLQQLMDGLKTRTTAQDAIVSVDGLQRSSSSNVVDGVIPGVSLNLGRTTADEPFELEILPDRSAIKSDVESFVNAWNAAASLLKTSSAYQPETRSAAVLTGDSLVRNLQQQLRDGVSEHSNALRAMGISLDKEGSMKFDAAAFDKNSAENPDALAQLFARDGRYSVRLHQLLDNNLDSGNGSLTLRSKTLDRQISEYKKQMEQLDMKMDKLNSLYTAQFTAMETMITKMQSGAGALEQLVASSR